MPEIERSAFLYLEPLDRAEPSEHDESFAQCGECRLWLSASNQCKILDSHIKVEEGDSCNLFIPFWWLDPEEVGFVKGRVQCHRCEHAMAGATHCGLFAELGIDPAIKPHGCCNAFEPLKEKSKGGKLYDHGEG